MKHTAFITAVLAAAGVAAAGAALAGSGGYGKSAPHMTFEQLDTDGSGEITRAELENMRSARFAAADANGDGKLTLEELQAQNRKKADERAAGMLKKLDKNGDNALSQDELSKPRRAGKMFDKMDADGSGGISAEEFAELQEKMQRHGKRKGHGNHSGNN